MTEASSRPMCVQCGKPAFVMLDDVPVCIDCNYKFQQTQWMQFVQAATMANAAERDIFATVGMEHLATPIEIPPAPIPPLHYNNQIVNVTGGNGRTGQ